MKLSAPIYVLKSRAKALKKSKSLSMVRALDNIAQEEGYSSWSLLQSKNASFIPTSDAEILAYLNPGDLMLLGARPGMGKTRFAFDLLVQALEEERKCYFFSLEYVKEDIDKQLNRFSSEKKLDAALSSGLIKFDFSDEISAAHIIEQSSNEALDDGLIIVDYLQLLDQKRSKPVLQTQIEALKNYAEETGVIIVFLSQIDRAFRGGEVLPSEEDIRMPNDIDLGLFNKIMVMNQDKKVFLRPQKFELI